MAEVPGFAEVRAEQVRRALLYSCPACAAAPGEACGAIKNGLVYYTMTLRFPHRDRLPPYDDVRRDLEVSRV